MHGEDTVNLGNVFAMFEAIREHAEGESFCFGDSFVASGPVREHSGQIRDLAYPATVIFSLDLKSEVAHARMVQRVFTLREIRLSNGSAAAWSWTAP